MKKLTRALVLCMAVVFSSSFLAPSIKANATIYIPGESGSDSRTTNNDSSNNNSANNNSSNNESSKNTSNNSSTNKSGDTSILKPEYFDDDYFYQLNTAVLVPEIYTLADYNRLQTNKPSDYAYNKSIDVSHIIGNYVAPVTKSGTSYMIEYDYTYVYSNDELTANFMNLMASDTVLRNKIMNASEYSDLVSVYNQYVNNKNYDVNPYVYHYIVRYIDFTYGDKLFDYDFYCKTYPSLAMLFEYDEAQLKQHFYSVGIFEGRQGIDTFNVDNYTSDNDDFGTYYIQYVTGLDSSKTYARTKNDKAQIRLYDVGFASYVADVSKDHKSKTYVQDLASPYVQGELNAQACHRVRFQLGDYTAQGHNALKAYINSRNMIPVWGLRFSGTPFNGAENAWTEKVSNVNYVPDLTDSMVGWRQCNDHYEAATSAEYIYVGQSHPYVDYNPYAGTNKNTGVGLRANKYVITTMTWMYNDYGAATINSYYN